MMIKNLKYYLKRILFNTWYLFFRRYKRNSIFFITSTGRTGTNFFEHFFNSFDNNVYCIHEPKPDFFDLSMEKIRTNISYKRINKKIVNQREREFHEMFKKNKSIYIESNPFIYPLMQNLKGVFINSKYIIITRDPKTYVQSALNKSPQDDGKFFFYDKDDKRKRLEAKDFRDDQYYDKWNKLERFQKISWYWNKCNKMLYGFHIKNKSVVLHINYEDLFSVNYKKRKETILKVLNFVGINVSDDIFNRLVDESYKKKNSTKVIIHDKYETWSTSDKQKLNELTQEMRKKLNY